MIYAVLTSGSKTVIGLLLAVLLTSGLYAHGFLRIVVFFPVLVSTIGIGLTFFQLMHPTKGAINVELDAIGLPMVGWLTTPRLMTGKKRGSPCEGCERQQRRSKSPSEE